MRQQSFKYAMGPWTCDVCGKEIKSHHALRLQWTSQADNEQLPAPGVAITITHDHQSGTLEHIEGRCTMPRERNSSFSDLCLASREPPDVLVRLLALMIDKVFDAEAVSPIIMRLFVPGYEQTRHFLKQAIAEGEVTEDAKGRMYMKDIRNIREHYGV